MVEGISSVVDGVEGTPDPLSREGAEGERCGQRPLGSVLVCLDDGVVEAAERQGVVGGDEGDPAAHQWPLAVAPVNQRSVLQRLVGPDGAVGVGGGRLVQSDDCVEEPGADSGSRRDGADPVQPCRQVTSARGDERADQQRRFPFPAPVVEVVGQQAQGVFDRCDGPVGVA